MLDWLDALPDMRIPGVHCVHGVHPQKTAVSECTPASVQPKPAESRHSTPCTPCTPETWNSLAEKLDPIGAWARAIRDQVASQEPSSIAPDRWREVLGDAKAFLAMWGEQAVALGWTDRDLFAVPPGPERWMRMGLVALLRGRPVVAITAETITIDVRGGQSRYRRSPNEGAVMLWDRRAYSEQEGS